MSIFAWAAIAAVIFVGGFAGGIKWHVGQDAIKEVARQEAAAEKQRMDAKRIDGAATGHEADKGAIRTEFVTITETVERIVREPFYAAPDAAACLDPAGLFQLRAAIAPADAASQPAHPVPRPDRAD